MLPSIISRIGKKSGQGYRAEFEGGILRDPDFVEGPNDQRKEFLAFWDYIFVGLRSYGGHETPCSLFIWPYQES